MTTYYLTSVSAIAHFFRSVLATWGLYVESNTSFQTESIYLKICLGTKEKPKNLHIRISNHPASLLHTASVFDIDIFAGYARDGACNYIKVLMILATNLNKALPQYWEFWGLGSLAFKHYSIEMKRRQRFAKGSRRCFTQDRLYLR
jgi:hypothetical protein